MKRLLTLLASSAVLMVPAAASATIVPQQGIGGVKLNQTKQRVRAVAGKPLRVDTYTDDFGDYTTFAYPQFSVSFREGNRVTSVVTFSRRQRTSSDIGIGSTEAEVAAAYPDAECRSFGRTRACLLGAPGPKARITSFDIAGRKVILVQVSFSVN
jgi:hypothetical protein